MKPIKVKNPTSMQHIVRIKSGQYVQLHLDENIFPNHEIRISPSDNIFIGEQERSENYSTYLIFLNDNIKKWADYSSVYLGEIWIDSKKESSRLLILMESSNDLKSNFITTINPDYLDIRINPGDIIEVILFNVNSERSYNWDWSFNPKTECNVEFLGTSDLDLQICLLNNHLIDCPELLYASFPRIDIKKNTNLKQKHFWFRFDKKMLLMINEMNGINHLGDFVFTGYFDKNFSVNDVQRTLSVHVNLDNKYKMRMFNSLLLPKLNEAGSDYFFVISPSVRDPNTHNKKQNYVVRDVDIKK